MQSFNPQRAPVFGKAGMACSSQPLAAAVGRDILKAGGNAADAAIAMAAMVNVTEPMMNGLGGDCMILAHWNGECFGLNSSGRSGSRLTIDNLRAAGFSAMPQAGAAAVTVPGALDAYLTLHERFGTMELADLFEPAAACAEEGFAVGTKIAQVWEWGASKLERFSVDASPYLPGGAAPKAGDIFRQQDLARTWRSIGKNGRGAFYAGDVRDRILDVLHKGGGFLDSEDFDRTQAEWVEPLRAAYRGHTIVELPPNGQGLVALMALGMLEAYDLPRLFVDDEVLAKHLILEAIKLAFADAVQCVADPRFAATPVDRLLSQKYLGERRALIEPDRALDAPPAGRVYGDTTYLTVVDRDRNAVSLITSISDVFGSGIIVPGAGVILHNRGADFEMDPAHPNHAAPGKRVRHTILPSMMLAADGALEMSFGCMGANMQPQGQVQILVNLIDRGFDLQQALDAPRVRALDGRRISAERHQDQDFAGKLAARGHQVVAGEEIPNDWMVRHDFMRSFEGCAQAIAIAGEALCGASDPRLDGIAAPL
jgi:gamma-glutamyltranspeptidase / glutathione hydrolase